MENYSWVKSFFYKKIESIFAFPQKFEYANNEIWGNRRCVVGRRKISDDCILKDLFRRWI